MLTSALGLASYALEAPVPNALSSNGFNATLATCDRLEGVTPWNSSGIPVFTGAFTSGAAPFWSFLVENATHEFVFATDLLGASRIYTAQVSTPCAIAAGLAGVAPVNGTITTDSAAVARMAFSAAGAPGSRAARVASPFGEYLVLGGAQVEYADASPFGWVVNYFRCDVVGIAGTQNYSAVGTIADGDPWFVDQGWLTCTGIVPTYVLAFSTTSNVTPAGQSGTYLATPFQVTRHANNTSYFDLSGLQTWMTELTLENRSGVALQATSATCARWVASLAACPASSSGWFAVLLSADGGWLDSFPSGGSSTNWTIPNVIMASHESVVLVAPSSWNVTGDKLAADASSPVPSVSGSVTL